jgi:hypothetical protein
MAHQLQVTVFLLCVTCLALTGCTEPQSVVQTRLGKLLEANDFTLYTPMRRADYPGTIFVLASNHWSAPILWSSRYESTSQHFSLS